MTVTSKPGGRGRPPTHSARSHAKIIDTVYALLLQKSIRDLSMEEVAKQAGVGKQTLYKWWPTKAALAMAMFHERMGAHLESMQSTSAEQAIRERVRRVIVAFQGPLGKIMADLIAEGQSEPDILRALYERHINDRRLATIDEIEGGKRSGELRPDTDAGLLVDAVFGAIYYRLLLKSAPLSEQFGDDLVDQALRGLRSVTTA